MKLRQLHFQTKRRPDSILEFFDSSYSRIYSELLNIELKAQLKFIKDNYLKEATKNNFPILDLCCGEGRHLTALNAKYHVDGIDINRRYVEKASTNLDKTASGKVYVADAKTFISPYKYALIYSMESSLGYLSDKETAQIFKNIKENLLSNNGTFVLHLNNKDHLLQNLVPRMWFGDQNTGYLLEQRTLNALEGTLRLDQIRIINGIEKHYAIDLRLYTLQEIKYLIEQAGLTLTNVYGDYDNSPYTSASPYMIIEAKNI